MSFQFLTKNYIDAETRKQVSKDVKIFTSKNSLFLFIIYNS